MSFVNILELSDNGTLMRIEVDPKHSLVRITEDANTNIATVLVVTSEGLTDIANAVAQHLESAAEYIGATPAAEPLFTEEDLEAGRQAIADLEVP